MDTDLKPKVSVVMPVYNAAPYLKEAVESILSQTYQNFELLIINDGSTDDSLRIIQRFSDARIKIINNEFNIGIIKSRNKGLQLARGEYIAKMDADDISLPSRFEKQVSFLDKNREVAVLATKLVLINDKGERIGNWQEDAAATTTREIKNMLPVINCIGQPTVMMRADIAKKIGYNKKFLHNEDWGLWLDMLSENYGVAKLNEVLVKYRVHSAGTTVNSNARGVQKKLIRFKTSYLKEKLFHGKLKKLHVRIFSSLLKDMLNYLFPRLYKGLANLRRAKAGKLVRQFFIARKKFSNLNGPIKNFFFFPNYHIGGAERVHVSILSTIPERKPLVFITGVSRENFLLPEFEKFATVIDVSLLLMTGPTQRWIRKKILTLIQDNASAVLFGCNSFFFYELLPFVPEKITCIDLIHAFVDEFEDGPEKWSLPMVHRLNRRIVIAKKTIEDFEKLYFIKKVDPQYLTRIEYVPNYVEPKNLAAKNSSSSLRVLYVGRGAPEKRIHLISRAARLCGQKNFPVTFSFIGDVQKNIPQEDAKFCNVIGEVSDEKIMDAHYDKAHLLALTSSREGFPMVIMEAMMHGVIPVTTNVGGIALHVHHKENGILINETEEDKIVNEIVNAVEYFIRNRNEMDEMSRQAYNYASRNFKKQDFIDSYRKLLVS